MKSTQRPVHQISLRLHDVWQLFNSMDPTPFLHRDLDPDAEEFIESWALEFPSASRFEITIHLQQMPAEGDPTALVAEALHNYYEYKAELARRELKQLMRQGRVSLLIGLAFVAACLFAAEAIGNFASGTFLNIARESLTIGSWVALWRPLQIFLYDWWPVTHRQGIYRKLGRAHVHVLQGK